jgi:hypothetical protein
MTRSHHDLVLAMCPTARGLGFALMAGPLSPIDWGVKETKGKEKNVEGVEKAVALLEAHQPDVLVLEDSTAEGSRRSARIRRLNRSIELFARTRAIEVHRYSRPDIRRCFERFGASTRYETAQVIAKNIPAFTRLLPKKPNAWESEPTRMALFNAAALALSFYFHTSDERRETDRPKEAA